MTVESFSKRPLWHHPNREFYLADHRSAQLRGESLNVIRYLLALLYCPEVVAKMGGESAIYVQLEILNGRLIELGVGPDMQTGYPPEIYETNPVTSAEWVAGQLIKFTGERIPSEATAKRLIEEFSDSEAGAMRVIGAKNMPNRLVKYYDTAMIVAGLCSQLGVENEELPEFPWLNGTA